MIEDRAVGHVMQLRSNVSLEEGHKNLRQIIKEIGKGPIDWNEANTRFHIIDRILVECLAAPGDQEAVANVCRSRLVHSHPPDVRLNNGKPSRLGRLPARPLKVAARLPKYIGHTGSLHRKSC
jgi:hypothetical protein